MIYKNKKKKIVILPSNRNLIAVDVDGTLLIRGQCNQPLIEWIRNQKADGKSFMLWSARGEDHARNTAEQFDIADLFDTIIGKPTAIIDDKGWQWTKFSKVLNPLSD